MPAITRTSWCWKIWLAKLELLIQSHSYWKGKTATCHGVCFVMSSSADCIVLRFQNDSTCKKTLSAGMFHCTIMYKTLSAGMFHCTIMYKTLSAGMFHCTIMYKTLSAGMFHCTIITTDHITWKAEWTSLWVSCTKPFWTHYNMTDLITTWLACKVTTWM